MSQSFLSTPKSDGLTKKRQEELESEDTKFCTGCKQVKPLFEFAIHAKKRKFASTYCSKCDCERRKENNIFRTYGISLKQYDKMLEKQGNSCKICETKIPGGRGRFHIDHDHITGKIRGLLCINCNLILGNAKDDIGILAATIQYLVNSGK